MGPVMAGIVGRERYQFVAARLTGVASPGTVAVTEEISAGLPGTDASDRGAVELKGKGCVRMVEVTAMTRNISM
jgi:class 3 adenylate cyclase